MKSKLLALLLVTAEAPDTHKLPPQCIPCIEQIMIAWAEAEPLAGQMRLNAVASGGAS